MPTFVFLVSFDDQGDVLHVYHQEVFTGTTEEQASKAFEYAFSDTVTEACAKFDCHPLVISDTDLGEPPKFTK